jgi:hypothetical protein
MSGEATLDNPSLCYQDPGRSTGKLENTHCPEVRLEETPPVCVTSARTFTRPPYLASDSDYRMRALHGSCVRVADHSPGVRPLVAGPSSRNCGHPREIRSTSSFRSARWTLKYDRFRLAIADLNVGMRYGRVGLYSRSMETVHFGRALSYSHIFPLSRQRLRTSALYHDGIGRIVPERFVLSA